VSVNANRTATRSFDRRWVARSRFARVENAGCELRVAPVRDLVEVGVPVLAVDCEADPATGADEAGAEGDRDGDGGGGGGGDVAGRVGVVSTGGATGLGAGGLVTGGGVVTVTGGVLTVTGGGEGAGGSAVVTGSEGGGGAGGSAVVTGSEGGGGAGGSAVVTGNEGVVTVTPGRGGTSRASACAAMRPATAAARPQRLAKRDIPNLQRVTPANGCGPSYLLIQACSRRPRVDWAQARDRASGHGRARRHVNDRPRNGHGRRGHPRQQTNHQRTST
jgi:hypothetical protein